MVLTLWKTGLARWRRRLLRVTAVAVAAALFGSPGTAAAAPYEGYHYSYWGEATGAPQAYLPERAVSGASLGIGAFRSPEDVAVTADGRVYVLDSGNGRIVELDSRLQFVHQFVGFRNEDKDDTFAHPEGLFVTESGSMLVADTGNGRIVELAADGSLLHLYGAPQSDVLRSNFSYNPRKIAMDKAKRMYVIGKGVIDGIMEFDADGVFQSFTGTNPVRVNFADYMWKRISTTAQREQMTLFVPLEFNNLDVGEEGFLYTTTSKMLSTDKIQKLSPKGGNILKKQGFSPPTGDKQLAIVDGKLIDSLFVDIDVASDGTYSVLDSGKGRVFTYSDEGDLLYIFGGLGKMTGTFQSPAALERIGDRLLVLDRGTAQLHVFAPTLFGNAVNRAIALHGEGKEDEAARAWEQVLRLDANYEIAYTGIGKSLLRQGRNKEAMAYFKLGYNREYYSKAYARYRKDYMREHFDAYMSGLLLAALAVLAAVFARKYRRRRLTDHAG